MLNLCSVSLLSIAVIVAYCFHMSYGYCSLRFIVQMSVGCPS